MQEVAAIVRTADGQIAFCASHGLHYLSGQGNPAYAGRVVAHLLAEAGIAAQKRRSSCLCAARRCKVGVPSPSGVVMPPSSHALHEICIPKLCRVVDAHIASNVFQGVAFYCRANIVHRFFQKANKMRVKSIVSALALTTAFALSGPAFSQTMFNGAELSADDLPAVTERCEQLATAASTESLIEESNSSEDSTAGGADATITDAPAVNEAQQATATIDLDTVTLEQCTEAGIPAAM